MTDAWSAANHRACYTTSIRPAWSFGLARIADQHEPAGPSGGSVEGHIHAIGWHRDSARDPSLDDVWEPEESSYYDDCADNLGNST